MAHLLDIRRTLNLGFLGDAWKECELVLRPVPMPEMGILIRLEAEAKKADEAAEGMVAKLDLMSKTVLKSFVSATGIVYEDGIARKVQLDLDDVKQFGLDVIRPAYELIVGTPDPKSRETSNPS